MESTKNQIPEEKAAKALRGREIFEQLKTQKADGTYVPGKAATVRLLKLPKSSSTSGAAVSTPQRAATEADGAANVQYAAIIQRLEDNLRESQEKLGTALQKVAEQSQQMQSSQSDLKIKDERLAWLENKLKEESSKYSVLYEQMSQQSSVTRDQSKKASSLEVTLEQSKVDVRLLTAENEELRQQISSLKREQNSQIELHKQETAGHLKNITVLESKLSSMKIENQSMKDEIAKRSKEVTLLKDSSTLQHESGQQAATQISQLRSEMTSLQQRISSLDRENINLKTLLSEAEAQLKAETQDKIEVSLKLKELTLSRDNIATEKKEIESKHEIAVAQLSASNDQIINLQRQLQLISTQSPSGFSEEVSNLNQKMREMQQEKSAALLRVQKLESEVKELSQIKDELSTQLSNTIEQFKSTQSSLHSNHATAIKELELQRSALEEQVTQLEDQILIAHDENKNLSMQTKLLRKQSETERQEDVSKWTATLDEATKEIQDLQQKIDQLSTELKLTSQQKSILEDTVKTLTDQAENQVSIDFVKANRTILELQAEKARLTQQMDELTEERSNLLESSSALQNQWKLLSDQLNSAQQEYATKLASAQKEWEQQQMDYESKLTQNDELIQQLRAELVGVNAQNPNAYADIVDESGAVSNPSRTLEMELESLREQCAALSEENQHYADTIQQLSRTKREFKLPINQSVPVESTESTNAGFDPSHLTTQDIPLLLDTIQKLEAEVNDYTAKLDSLSQEKEKLLSERQSASVSSLKVDELKLRMEMEKQELLESIEDYKVMVDSLNRKIQLLDLKCGELERKVEENELKNISTTSELAEAARQQTTFQSAIADLNQKIEDLQEDRSQLNEKWLEVSSLLRVEKAKTDAMNSEKMQTTLRLRELQDSLEQVQAENTKLIGENRRLYIEKTQLERGMQSTVDSEQYSDQLVQKLESQYTAIQQLEQESLSSQLEVTRLQYLVEDKDRDISILKEQENESRMRLDEYRQRIESLVAANDDLQSSFHESESQRLSLLEDAQTLKFTKEHLEKEIQELRGIMSTGHSSSSFLNSEQSMLERTNAVLKQEKSTLESLLEASNKKVEDLKQSNQREQSRIHTLESSLQAQRASEKELASKLEIQTRKMNKIQEDHQLLLQNVEALREQNRQTSLQKTTFDADQHKMKIEHGELLSKLKIEQERHESTRKQKNEMEKMVDELSDKISEMALEKEEQSRAYKKQITSLQMKLREKYYLIVRFNATLTRLLQQLSSPLESGFSSYNITSNIPMAEIEDLETLEKRADEIQFDSILDSLEIAWSQTRQNLSAERDVLKRLLTSSVNDMLGTMNQVLDQTTSGNPALLLNQSRKSAWLESSALKSSDDCIEFVRKKTEEMNVVRENLLRESIKLRGESEMKTRELRKLQTQMETGQLDVQRDYKEKSESRELQRKFVQQIQILTDENEDLKSYKAKTINELETLRGIERRYSQMRKVWEQEISTLTRERDDTKKLAEESQRILSELPLSRSTLTDPMSSSRLRESIIQEKQELIQMVQKQKEELDILRSQSGITIRRDGDEESNKVKSMEFRIQTVEQELQLQRDYGLRERKAFEKERLCFEEEKTQLKLDLANTEKRYQEELHLEEMKSQRLQQQLEKAEQRYAELTENSSSALGDLEKTRSEMIALQTSVKMGERKVKELELRIEEANREKDYISQKLSEAEKANVQLKKMHQELIEAKTKNDGLVFNLTNLEEDVKRKQKKIDLLSQQLDSQNAEMHKLKEKRQLDLHSPSIERNSDKIMSEKSFTELHEIRKKNSELQMQLTSIQALIDSSLSLLSLRPSDSSEAKKMELLYLNIEELARRRHRFDQMEKEIIRIKLSIDRLNRHRINLIEQKRYLSLQLELTKLKSHFRSQEMRSFVRLSDPTPNKQHRQRLKAVAFAVIILVRIRKSSQAQPNLISQASTLKSDADFEHYLTQLRQKEENIRALRLQIQSFENQGVQQRQLALDYQNLQSRYVTLLGEHKDKATNAERVAQLDATVKAKDSTIGALKKQLGDLTKTNTSSREELRTLNEQLQRLQRDLQATTDRESQERQLRQKAESENRLLSMKMDKGASTSRFSHLAPDTIFKSSGRLSVTPAAQAQKDADAETKEG